MVQLVHCDAYFKGLVQFVEFMDLKLKTNRVNDYGKAINVIVSNIKLEIKADDNHLVPKDLFHHSLTINFCGKEYSVFLESRDISSRRQIFTKCTNYSITLSGIILPHFQKQKAFNMVNHNGLLYILFVWIYV